MKFYITYFYNIRFFTPNMIPVSTAIWDPKWIRDKTHNNTQCCLDKNNVLLGIKEESLIFDKTVFDTMDEQCQKDCPYKEKIPNCQFMIKYKQQLDKIDFTGYLLPELKRVAEDVRKITNYEGEPIIVLMVHEPPTVACSERPVLQKFFLEHGIILKEWSKDLVGMVF